MTIRFGTLNFVPTRLRAVIFSSSAGLGAARALQAEAAASIDATIWNQGLIRPSETTLQALDRATHEYDFAVIMLSSDDELADGRRVPRDNVIFEAGLFIHAFGLPRVLLVVPHGDQVKLPSDLDGLTQARYQSQRSDGNLQAALGPVADQLRAMGERLGRLESAGSRQRRAMLHARDLFSALAEGRVEARDATEWERVILRHAANYFAERGSTVAVTWLRPHPSHARLAAYDPSQGFLPGSYEFAKGEGLAGWAWEEAISAWHSPSSPHSRWMPRGGCENLSYLVVPVRTVAGDFGMLSAGSDERMAVTEEDVEALQMYASMLGVVCGPATSARIDQSSRARPSELQNGAVDDWLETMRVRGLQDFVHPRLQETIKTSFDIEAATAGAMDRVTSAQDLDRVNLRLHISDHQLSLKRQGKSWRHFEYAMKKAIDMPDECYRVASGIATKRVPRRHAGSRDAVPQDELVDLTFGVMFQREAAEK